VKPGSSRRPLAAGHRDTTSDDFGQRDDQIDTTDSKSPMIYDNVIFLNVNKHNIELKNSNKRVT